MTESDDGIIRIPSRHTVAKTMERVTRDPDPRWLGALAGEYTNADLGHVKIVAGPRGATFDAGEWSSAIGQKKDVDGTVKVVLMDPPVAGMELLIGAEPAHPTLTLLDDQVKYVFERAR